MTVVIPAYNRAHSLGRAIESVLTQTFQDFEIVVVDDASTDNTVDVACAFRDARIRLVRHETNRGAAAARNTGYRAGSAPYVAFLDSDDEWLPTKLERQLQVFERSDGRLVLVYTGAERIAPDGAVTRYMPPGHVDLPGLLVENVIGETSLAMIRRSALEAIGGFDESLPSAEDMDVYLRLTERFRAELVPELLVRVAKARRGRISVDIVAGAMGRERFRRKHKEHLVRHGVLHLHLRTCGWLYQREARDPAHARRCYLESVAANPFAPKTYVLLFMSFLPLSWLDRLAAWKKRVTGGSAVPLAEERAQS